MKFQTHLTAFQEQLRNRSASPRTVETYAEQLGQFLTFVETHYPRLRSIQGITRDVLADYLAFLQARRGRSGRPLANRTLVLKMKSVRVFFSFLAREGTVLRDPSSGVYPPREHVILSRSILSQDEVRELIQRTRPIDPLSMRNRAIVELFYGCGMRTSELCNLKVGDVDLKEQTVTIFRGKGGRSRVVPIGQYAAHYVELYLTRARKHMLAGQREDPGNLFLSGRGNPFDRSSINKTVIRSVSKNLSSGKRISAYAFRHGLASHLLANGLDVVHIAKLLGHRSLQTTQRYLSVEIGDLKRLHARLHPRETEGREAKPLDPPIGT